MSQALAKVSPQPPVVDETVHMRRVLEAARRFLACRDRALALAPWSESGGARNLGEAIERDFVGFDLERAETELRNAVAAARPNVMTFAPRRRR